MQLQCLTLIWKASMRRVTQQGPQRCCQQQGREKGLQSPGSQHCAHRRQPFNGQPHTHECVVDMDLQPQGQVFSLQQRFRKYLRIWLRWVLVAAYGIVRCSMSGDRTWAPALRAAWTTREVPRVHFKIILLSARMQSLRSWNVWPPVSSPSPGP